MTDQISDELEAMRKELGELKQEREVRDQELEARGAAIARLEKALADKDSELAVLKQTLTETEGKLVNASNTLAQSVAEYKALAVSANPGLPAELVTGSTISEVNESLQKARTIVERVKQGLAAEVAQTRIPAGAPQRTPPDVSALSPREKIQYGIGGNK